jgi:MoxR-like ATPase
MELEVDFSPGTVETIRKDSEDYRRALVEPMDQRDGSVYVYSADARLSIQVALAAGRPLLVRGDPGSGKSTLAAAAARWLKWRYYEAVITSRTQARDLQWNFDAVRRLGDAEAGTLNKDAGLYPYIEPEVLWWAFAPASAERRGLSSEKQINFAEAVDPGRLFAAARDVPAVVLLDEIDKADPDVPNDLLVALGSLSFTVREIDREITADRERPPLIIITTNEERDLPPAFLRRCVQVTLSRLETPEAFSEIARARFGPRDDQLYEQLAEVTIKFREDQEKQDLRPVSTAEYLDAVRACARLEVRVPNQRVEQEASDLWKFITRAVLKDPNQPIGR